MTEQGVRWTISDADLQLLEKYQHEVADLLQAAVEARAQRRDKIVPFHITRDDVIKGGAAVVGIVHQFVKGYS